MLHELICKPDTKSLLRDKLKRRWVYTMQCEVIAKPRLSHRELLPAIGDHLHTTDEKRRLSFW